MSSRRRQAAPSSNSNSSTSGSSDSSISGTSGSSLSHSTSDMATDIAEAHTALRAEISTKAQDIVNRLMPEKIMVLDQFYKNLVTTQQPIRDFRATVEGDLSTLAAKCTGIVESSMNTGKKRKIGEVDGDVSVGAITPLVATPANQRIVTVMNALKEELLQEIEMLNTVKIWIQLNIPRIEDGNNFGVGIQEEMVNELARAENDAIAVLDSMTKYFISRGRLLHKVIKYPQIEDYRLGVVELDEKEYINMRMCALELRNTYAILYDLIHKNKDKIEKPRSSHHASLY